MRDESPRLIPLAQFACKAIEAVAMPRADMAKLADAPDLGSGAARRGGSSPSTRTIDTYQYLGCICMLALTLDNLVEYSPTDEATHYCNHRLF
jgi:hypothetical protein